MTGRETDRFSADIASLQVEASAEEKPSSALDKMPERTCADDPHFDEPDKSTEANSARDFPSFRSTQLPQVDSHEEAAENIISYKPRLALLREEQQRIRAICLQANDAIEEQQRHVTCHEAAPNPPDHVKTRHYRLDIYEISASERRSGVFIGRENERLLKEQLKRTRAEAKQLELQVRKLELRDSQYERKLDGRSSTIPDSINFEKIYNDDLSTTVVELITYNLPKKEWKDPEMQRRCEGHDDGAFGVLRFDGILYRAKAGHERGDFGPFISSNHWREQARALSEIVNHPIEDNYAVHAEP